MQHHYFTNSFALPVCRQMCSLSLSLSLSLALSVLSLLFLLLCPWVIFTLQYVCVYGTHISCDCAPQRCPPFFFSGARWWPLEHESFWKRQFEWGPALNTGVKIGLLDSWYNRLTPRTLWSNFTANSKKDRFQFTFSCFFCLSELASGRVRGYMVSPVLWLTWR